MKNLTLENITNACKGTYHGDQSLLTREVANVVIDSRKVERGDLFVAIDGENVNAHKFIPTPLKKARCAWFPMRIWGTQITPTSWWSPPARLSWTSPSFTGIPLT